VRVDRTGYDAVVPAGGGARRLGGVDKPMVDIAGVSLLDRVLEACSGAAATVVVGPRRRVGRPVLWTAEQPPGGGPVAALVAGLAALDQASQGSSEAHGSERCESEPRGSEPWVGVFAADLPFLARPTVHRLWKTAVESAGSDGAVLTDDTGHEQWLAAVYRRSALDQALDALGRDRLAGASLRALLRGLRLERVPDGPAGESMDCDTWDDVAAARRLAGTRDRLRKDTENMLEPWLQEAAAALGLPGLDLAEEQQSALLDLARAAAHGVARPAAPLTTFLVGYALGGSGGLDDLERLAAKLTAIADARATPAEPGP
jgi:molybdopterin-guanine dinucleotide biosynthesis protein A